MDVNEVEKWKRLHDQQRAARDSWIEIARQLESARDEARGLWQAEYDRAERLRARIARVEALADRWDEKNYPGMIGIAKGIRSALVDPEDDADA